MNKILCKTIADGQVATMAADGLQNTTMLINHTAERCKLESYIFK